MFLLAYKFTNTMLVYTTTSHQSIRCTQKPTMTKAIQVSPNFIPGPTIRYLSASVFDDSFLNDIRTGCGYVRMYRS